MNDTSGCAKNVHYGDILVKFGESISAEKADLPFICEREILKKLSKSILKNGDVVIADTAEDMTTGKSCEIVDVDECMPVLAGLHTIPVRPKQKFGKYYLGYYLNSEAFHSQLIPLIQGIKVYSISKSSIKDTVVMFPDDVQEQEKIGSLFNRIDNTITLQQRKLNSLQKLKKGLLQKMFPKNGENIPEIRFPEFSDAWKQRELKEVVNFSRGQGLPWADVDDLNGQFECILYGNLYTDYGTIIQNIKHKTNTDLKVKSKGNEVLIPGSDTTPTGLARALFLEKENVILGGDINILSVKHDDGPFLAYELNKLKKELIIRIKGTTVKHLQNNDLKDIVVSLPSLEEQRKISSLFSRLDNTITLQQRWLFYTHKQS